MKLSDTRAAVLKDIRRIVIKIGSGVIASTTRGFNTQRVRRIVREIAELREAGYEVVIVSSGAIVAGMKELGLSDRPKALPIKQAAASVGQSKLIQMYERGFSRFGIKVAQILLTRDDISVRGRFLNARNTLITLLSYGVIPVINENDTVAVDEIKFGDNDLLSGLVTNLIDADMLIILSDIDGLFTSDPAVNPEAALIPVVEEIGKDIESVAGDSSAIEGTGGMASKVETAKKVSEYGIPTIIMNGKAPGLLGKALKGFEVGTIFLPKRPRLTSRKHRI